MRQGRYKGEHDEFFILIISIDKKIPWVFGENFVIYLKK
jgi:hypothetical protein